MDKLPFLGKGGDIVSKTNKEIALELTLSIVSKIHLVDKSSHESMNRSLAEQVADTYLTIYGKLGEDSGGNLV